jgi:hypothetical protein
MGFVPGWFYPGKPEAGLPKAVQRWSLTTLREKLVKIGAKAVRHGRYVTFQLAEVAVPRELSPNLVFEHLKRSGVSG